MNTVEDIENRFQLIREELINEFDDPENEDEDELNRTAEKVYTLRYKKDYFDDLDEAEKSQNNSK